MLVTPGAVRFLFLPRVDPSKHTGTVLQTLDVIGNCLLVSDSWNCAWITSPSIRPNIGQFIRIESVERNAEDNPHPIVILRLLDYHEAVSRSRPPILGPQEPIQTPSKWGQDEGITSVLSNSPVLELTPMETPKSPLGTPKPVKKSRFHPTIITSPAEIPDESRRELFSPKKATTVDGIDGFIATYLPERLRVEVGALQKRLRQTQNELARLERIQSSLTKDLRLFVMFDEIRSLAMQRSNSVCLIMRLFLNWFKDLAERLRGRAPSAAAQVLSPTPDRAIQRTPSRRLVAGIVRTSSPIKTETAQEDPSLSLLRDDGVRWLLINYLPANLDSPRLVLHGFFTCESLSGELSDFFALLRDLHSLINTTGLLSGAGVTEAQGARVIALLEDCIVHASRHSQ